MITIILVCALIPRETDHACWSSLYFGVRSRMVASLTEIRICARCTYVVREFVLKILSLASAAPLHIPSLRIDARARLYTASFAMHACWCTPLPEGLLSIGFTAFIYVVTRPRKTFPGLSFFVFSGLLSHRFYVSLPPSIRIPCKLRFFSLFPPVWSLRAKARFSRLRSVYEKISSEGQQVCNAAGNRSECEIMDHEYLYRVRSFRRSAIRWLCEDGKNIRKRLVNLLLYCSLVERPGSFLLVALSWYRSGNGAWGRFRIPFWRTI